MSHPTDLLRRRNGTRDRSATPRGITSLARSRHAIQLAILWGTFAAAIVLVATVRLPGAPRKQQSDNPAAEAKTEADMKPYTQEIRATRVKFDMIPVRGGTFVMGSPDNEPDRDKSEGPQHEVQVSPFWMGKYEVTWDQYEQWAYRLEQRIRKFNKIEPTPLDKLADAVTRPTKPYTDMTFGMGHEGYPAICMTQLAAKTYCEWLSAKTGHYYRLPTEAEWEYACRAGTTTAYSFGDDPDQLGDYAWYFDNAKDKYHKVGEKKPNPWGLYDMHGNVAEWCLDQYTPAGYKAGTGGPGAATPLVNPLVAPTKLYPRVVRGGSWDDDPKGCRSASRRGSGPEWKAQDPQLPQSVWYHTDAEFVGFRVVRPLVEPSDTEKAKYAPDKSQLPDK